MSLLYDVVYVNPNEDCGGGGTLCAGGIKGEDCQGPWVVFPAVETDYAESPHAVLCAFHARDIAALVGDGPKPERPQEPPVPSQPPEGDDDVPEV